ncbi:cell division protein ZapE [Marinicellulosiphila megalodicopiae]|uniref:cell division protein ZapE n=1 Tax=Marinicellulosiphila megalodicopiae TaxID=2724896 RepID=UPI003BAF2523
MTSLAVNKAVDLMTPIQKYKYDIEHNGFSYDPAQEEAIEALDQLFHKIINKPAPKNSMFSKLFAKKTVEPEIGLYFWGGVGRGKTYLMDLFFDALPSDKKLRTHFHRFMKLVHEQLVGLTGQKNPLEIVADDLAGKYQVLCFDEFFVSDIGDAMILGTLMEHLFARGVCLITTSNIVPSGLYKNGLQRKRFLPAIALLEKYTKVMNVDGGTDYRLRTLEQATLYHHPHNDEAMQKLEESFKKLSPDSDLTVVDAKVEILGRHFLARRMCEDVIWFEFNELCDGPRSQNDYIELARIYHTVVLSKVPQFGEKNDDVARRFIYLVDEFYDRNIKLLISADVSITEIYTTGKHEFEFERTQSRLLEMQSKEYLAREHLGA